MPASLGSSPADSPRLFHKRTNEFSKTKTQTPKLNLTEIKEYKRVNRKIES